MNIKQFLLSAIIILSSNVNANIITIEGNTRVVNNCFPFGCPNIYGPHMGFVYKNIDSFSLTTGDTISFDLGGTNSDPFDFDISLAHTTTNGSSTPLAFTTVVNSGTGTGQGNSIIGDYDLSFTVDTDFVFSGGGLIIDFAPRGSFLSNDSTTFEQILVNSNADDTSGFFVSRYSYASTAGNSLGDGSFATAQMANFQIETVVPVPAAVWLFGSGFLGLIGVAKRKRV